MPVNPPSEPITINTNAGSTNTLTGTWKRSSSDTGGQSGDKYDIRYLSLIHI